MIGFHEGNHAYFAGNAKLIKLRSSKTTTETIKSNLSKFFVEINLENSVHWIWQMHDGLNNW